MKGRNLARSVPAGEGGADVSYDGAHKSPFEEALAKGKGTTNFEKRAERFKVQEAGPEVDVVPRGIADSAAGKEGARWAAGKPRFQDPVQQSTVGAGDYAPVPSVFETVKSGPSPMMRTPEKGGGRSDGWMTQADHVSTPEPADLPGAFDGKITNKPSTFTASSKPRFQEPQPQAGGDPGAVAPPSSFERAVGTGKPSSNFAQSSDRFKKMYDQPSYGDPGAHKTASDVEREERERRLAHLRAQEDAKAQIALSKQENY